MTQKMYCWKILDEFKKRRILRYEDNYKWQIKDLQVYNNYELGLSRYKIVPLIFPKENMDKNQNLDKLSYSFRLF
jgi:hypothetical protein